MRAFTTFIVAIVLAVVSAVGTVLSVILDGLDVIEVGPPAWVYQAVGLTVFFASVGWLLYRTHRHRHIEVVRGQSTPAAMGPGLQVVADDPKALREHDRLATQARDWRLPAYRIASKQMFLAHGHVDVVGLQEALRTGAAFNADNCLLCGKPRFEKRGHRPQEDEPEE